MTSPAGPRERPWRFADAGTTLLRTTSRQAPEIWCRCDGGPHGYLSIAAHAHADALSVEVRYGGVDVLADPGTYCYHGEPAWRSYFRSTIAHNTVELDGRSQSSDGGPFLWLRHAQARELDVQDIGDAAEWTAEHDGYLALHPSARHRRTVWLDRASRSIDIVDEIGGGGHDVRLAFHLGPKLKRRLEGACAILGWPGASTPGAARLELPPVCGGACTEGRPIPSSAGTPRASGGAFPLSRSSAADAPRPGSPDHTAGVPRRQNAPNLPFPGKPYDGAGRRPKKDRRSIQAEAR